MTPATQQPLDRAFNVAVNQIASRLFPTGYDVSYDNAPSTLEELTAHIERTGRMLVWSGASDDTAFACPETNWAFRAWHDWHHWKGQLPFDRDGETEAAKRQIADIVTLYGNEAFTRRAGVLIWAEVVGQLEHKERHGEFPADQSAFAEAYLRQDSRFGV